MNHDAGRVGQPKERSVRSRNVVRRVALPPVSFEMTISEVEGRGVLRDRVSELRHAVDVIDHRIALNEFITSADSAGAPHHPEGI